MHPMFLSERAHRKWFFQPPSFRMFAQTCQLRRVSIADTPSENGWLLLGAAKHVEGENVITSVCWASLINSLVHVADFHTPLA